MKLTVIFNRILFFLQKTDRAPPSNHSRDRLPSRRRRRRTGGRRGRRGSSRLAGRKRGGRLHPSCRHHLRTRTGGGVGVSKQSVDIIYIISQIELIQPDLINLIISSRQFQGAGPSAGQPQENPIWRGGGRRQRRKRRQAGPQSRAKMRRCDFLVIYYYYYYYYYYY